ncbi:hypothetical protein AUR04nite_15810 [Glutamicibacter uratoxydans]|uniref:Methyltransferase domain-containing protein n=1 Tax=Glutamicibacter uratoxydans TaxID=43667 RepID=A0A4Y4DL63_GLUUR|nr:class I SAM-dependent methyltransferase [Glutamicibacter uratoxydans]GED06049.1 hypothetical protein AUR04nite_15810 [Glutamicibacter uratoxydans]
MTEECMHTIRDAYAARAQEYISLLGSMQDMESLDVELISQWAQDIDGPIVDAGSGPGHWTDYLRRSGADIQGLDAVPAFIASARSRFPDSRFSVGNLSRMPFAAKSLGGVLAWYSIIHIHPANCGGILAEFARVLKSNGALLIGAFQGPQSHEFDHAVLPAFYWSESALCAALEGAGFMVVESHKRTVQGRRPHLDVLARRI